MTRWTPTQVLPALALAALLAACATKTSVTAIGDQRPPSPPTCDVTFFKDGEPDQPFEVIGVVETHVPSNAFFNPKADLENGGYAELRKRACTLGGNGVIIDHYIESEAVEFSHVHIWATIIVLRAVSPTL